MNDFSLSWFLGQVAMNPVLLITILLTLGVIFVNGWTDAPNAIATCVATRAMPPRAAVLMAAFFNLLGTFVLTLVNSTVAMTIKNMMIVIVGGGKVGYYLAKTLAPEKHRLVLLETDAQQCAKIAGELSSLGIELICGDGTEITALQDAGIEHAGPDAYALRPGIYHRTQPDRSRVVAKYAVPLRRI